MIILSTVVWEKTFEEVLKQDSWFLTYKSPLITRKLLVVNNVDSIEHLKQMIEGKDIEVCWVDDYQDAAKKHFGISIDENTLGYYYTIPYFVLLYKYPEHYIFNVASDCDVVVGDDFFEDSIKELRKNNVYSTTIPWSDTIDVGKHEQVEEYPESDKFNYSTGFTDQVFFTDTKKLKGIDFTIDCDGDFPFYGGNSFEKRIICYQRAENKYRAVYKKYNFKHNK